MSKEKLSLTVDKEIKDIIKSIADKEHMTMSAYITHLVIKDKREKNMSMKEV